MDNVLISHINSSSPKYQQAWELREEILRKPLGMSLKNEDLSRDHIDTIFIGEYNDLVVATLMLHHIDRQQIQLRAMAVYKEWQGKGIGKQLVTEAEKFSEGKGYSVMILHARKVAMDFYKSLGYRVCSEEFTEVGIPHYLMEKQLTTR